MKSAVSIVLLSLGVPYFLVIPGIVLATRDVGDTRFLWMIPLVLFPVFMAVLIARIRKSEADPDPESYQFSSACDRLSLCCRTFAWICFAGVIGFLVLFAIADREVPAKVLLLPLVVAGVAVLYFVLGHLAQKQSGIIVICIISLVIGLLAIADRIRVLYLVPEHNPGIYLATGALYLWLIGAATYCLAMKRRADLAMDDYHDNLSQAPPPPVRPAQVPPPARLLADALPEETTENKRSAVIHNPTPASPAAPVNPPAGAAKQKIFCPHCNQKYSVEDDMIGETITCQVCQQSFTV